MAATTGFRTLYPALIPPGTAHIDGVMTASGGILETVAVGAMASSILADYLIRSTGLQNIHATAFEILPMPKVATYVANAVDRYLRLNCLTPAYASLWKAIKDEKWTIDVLIFNAKKRFHAQNEVDAAIALSLGITIDELCLIYRTQFPVMRRYDQENNFDANGRKVPKEIMRLQEKAKENQLPKEQRTWSHPQSEVIYTFEYPFTRLDREADLRRAYAQFSSEQTGAAAV